MNSQSKLKKRLATYGAMGVGAVTFTATAANADICHTDLAATGEELVFTSASPVSIDLDGDGSNDFQLELGTFGPNGFSSSSWQLNLRGIGSNMVAANGAPAALPAFSSGASISGQDFVAFGYFQRAYTSYNPTGVYGGWPAGTSGFVGVQFTDGTGTSRFGWIEVAVEGSVASGDFSDISVTVSQFAFGKDEPIVTGQTVSAIPEPTALGLLALGGVGVLARRRRKNAA